MKQRGAILIGVLCLGMLVFAAPDEPPAVDDRERAQLERGRSLYRIYCLNCHGGEGRGDGPTAEVLLVQPTDLTRLSRDNEGDFPFDRVFRTIDGRRAVRGHGMRKMPIWGISLQEWDKDTNQDDEVAGRILHLTYYLKSLQQVED